MIDFARAMEVLLPREGPDCRLSPGDIVRGQDHAARLIYINTVWFPVLEKFMIKARAFKNQAIRGKGKTAIELPSCPVFPELPPPLEPGSLKVLTKMVNLMNLADDDNPRLKELDLSFIRSPKNGANRAYPDYPASCVEGSEHKQGRIAFKKNGNLGVIIQGRYFEGEWETLTTDTKSPYVDTRPLQKPGVPEVRQYRLRFWNGGSADSEWSPVQSVFIIP